MTAVVDQSLGVVGGQGVLYLLKSCAGENSVHVSR